ncbi:MAG: hypothetical protein KAX31_04785 [Thermoplasmata archaeon]|nr:hypothetical protein [Thermoplasmata archaeon]
MFLQDLPCRIFPRSLYSSDSRVFTMSKETVNINVRVTSTLKKIIEKYIDMDTHINLSDFARDALREKIKRDAPHFFVEMFREKPESA